MSNDREVLKASFDEPARFAELFERYADRIHRYAVARVGVENGEDILSETFIVAFQRRARFDLQWESAGPWLFGIATNVIRRQRKDELRALRSAEAWASVLVDRVDDVWASGERLDARRRVERLVPAIAALAARDRDVLLLYAWADLDYQGVADALGIPVGTVRSRLNRARRKLAAHEISEDPLAGADRNQKEGGIDGHLGRTAPLA